MAGLAKYLPNMLASAIASTLGGGGAPTWTPATWFLANEQGIWLDPSDFSTMFQDSAGTTPVTAVEQPVGLMLDKRLGLVRGVELTPDSGSFGSAAGWTVEAGWSIADGIASFPVTDVAGRNIGVSGVTVAGKTYEFTCNVTRLTGGWSFFAANVGDTARTESGAVRGIYRADTTGPLVFLARAGFTGSIDNFRIRELPGNHAHQPTTAQKPVLKTSGGLFYQNRDGVDDNSATAAGGGATTAALIIMGFRTNAIGAAQTLFSDRSGNTGLKLEITAGGNIAFSGGNGASINTATGAAVAAHTDYVVTAKYDGANLSVQLNRGSATTAACALSAGTAAITLGKDNGAATGYHNGRQHELVYIKNVPKSAGEIATAEAFVATKTGVTLP